MGPVLNTDTDDYHPAPTSNGLSLFFTRGVVGVGTGPDIWVTHRSCDNPSCPWEAPAPVAALNTASADAVPNITPDGHWIFFHSNRPGGRGGADLYVAYRADVTDDFAWQKPINLGNEINTAAAENGPVYFVNATAGRQELYYSVTPLDVPGATSDIWLSTRPLGEDPSTPWPAGAEVKSLNTPFNDDRLTIRRDGLEMIFASDRTGTIGGTDMWQATRASTLVDWSNIQNLGAPINTAFSDGGPALSFDGKTLYFMSTRPGGFGGRDLYMATRSRLCPP
jgi:hypothetical protein